MYVYICVSTHIGVCTYIIVQMCVPMYTHMSVYTCSLKIQVHLKFMTRLSCLYIEIGLFGNSESLRFKNKYERKKDGNLSWKKELRYIQATQYSKLISNFGITLGCLYNLPFNTANYLFYYFLGVGAPKQCLRSLGIFLVVTGGQLNHTIQGSDL